MDPYKVLDLDRDATTAQIRKAYRQRAAETHPDAGGSVAAFQEAKLAQDVLLDPKRRAKFDKDGTIDEGTADNAAAEILDFLANMVATVTNQILQQAEDQGPSLDNLDLLAMLKDLIKKQITEADTVIANAERNKRIVTRLQTKWRRKKKAKRSQGELEKVAKGMLDQADEFIRRQQHGQEVRRAGLEILNDYEMEGALGFKIWTPGSSALEYQIAQIFRSDVT